MSCHPLCPKHAGPGELCGRAGGQGPHAAFSHWPALSPSVCQPMVHASPSYDPCQTMAMPSQVRCYPLTHATPWPIPTHDHSNPWPNPTPMPCLMPAHALCQPSTFLAPRPAFSVPQLPPCAVGLDPMVPTSAWMLTGGGKRGALSSCCGCHPPPLLPRGSAATSSV